MSATIAGSPSIARLNEVALLTSTSRAAASGAACTARSARHAPNDSAKRMSGLGAAAAAAARMRGTVVAVSDSHCSLLSGGIKRDCTERP